MQNAGLTRREKECLFAVKKLDSDFPPRIISIAKETKIKPPTAYNLLKRLSDKGLIEESKGMVKVTDKGNAAYKEIMMAHRCIELIFSRAGIPKDCACREAEKIDYMLKPEYVKLLFKSLGMPKNCPHGKPIVV